ncbi:hypothetical protein NDU88_006122 [Pleurodeles waltl]|uniref:Uncharacterized protein n=1 Tax=Pleurodeles waltl TaxID=8319 RepID=A0AAV7X399_PLEWA|nr:hypothetical protein NDU88_006122 [Pleurodeles waltl]
MQRNFARRRLTRRLRCDCYFDTRPTGSTYSRPRTTQPDFQGRNQHSACRAGEISTQCPLDQRKACDFAPQAQDSTRRSWGTRKPHNPKRNQVRALKIDAKPSCA